MQQMQRYRHRQLHCACRQAAIETQPRQLVEPAQRECVIDPQQRAGIVLLRKLEQLLIGDHASHVVAQFLHDVVDDTRQHAVGAGIKAVLHQNRHVFPQHAILAAHHLIDETVQLRTQPRQLVRHDLFRSDLLENLVDGAQPFQQPAGPVVDEIAGVAVKIALPADPGAKADRAAGNQAGPLRQPHGQPATEGHQQWQQGRSNAKQVIRGKRMDHVDSTPPRIIETLLVLAGCGPVCWRAWVGVRMGRPLKNYYGSVFYCSTCRVNH